MKKKILAKTGRQEQDKVVEDILELHRDDFTGSAGSASNTTRARAGIWWWSRM